MNNTQKWLLVISALVASGALAYYFLVYIPRVHQEQITTQQNQVRKQAITECKKERDKFLESLHPTEDQLETTRQLINQMWPEGSIETCADKLIRDWNNP